MTASPIVTSSYSRSYETGPLYLPAILQGMQEEPLIVDRVLQFHQFPPGADGRPNQFVRWQNLAGTTLPSIIAEGASLPESAPIERYTRELKAKMLGLSIKFTDAAERFSGAGNVVEYGKKQGRGWTVALRRIASQIFNQAFTTSPAGAFSKVNCWDAKALCATDHPLLDGQTCSNKGTAALAQASLEDAIAACMEFKDDRNNIWPMSPKLLVVPPKLRNRAYRLLESENIAESKRALVADSGNPTRATDDGPNTANPIRSFGLEIVVLPEIGAAMSATGDYAAGSDTAWFLVDPAMFDAHLYNLGLAPETKIRDGEGLTQIWENFSYFDVGCGDWRGIWGSTGAT